MISGIIAAGIFVGLLVLSSKSKELDIELVSTQGAFLFIIILNIILAKDPIESIKKNQACLSKAYMINFIIATMLVISNCVFTIFLF